MIRERGRRSGSAEGGTEAIMANDRFPIRIRACHYSLDDDPRRLLPSALPSFLPPNAHHMICARSRSIINAAWNTTPLPPPPPPPPGSAASAAAISDVIIHLLMMKVIFDHGLGAFLPRGSGAPKQTRRFFPVLLWELQVSLGQ